MRKQLLTILKNEVKPAVGCTEPIAVALAGAKARELLGEEPVSVKITTSSNVFKNGMCVGIPGTARVGLAPAAALGIIAGDASKGLSVLENITPEGSENAEAFLNKNIIDIGYINNTAGVYIKLVLKGANSESEVVINEKHDNIVYLRANEKVLLDTPIDNNSNAKENIYDSLTVRELYDYCLSFTEEEIDFLWDGVEMNTQMAEHGLNNKVGGQVGLSIGKAIDRGDMANNFHSQAVLWTAAASDARMSGAQLPVMSSSGSGNHGLTAIIPIAVYARMHNTPRLHTLRALAMSHLLTSYIKSYTGRLSAVCGCSAAAATGATFGLAYLMGLGFACQTKAVEMMIASVSGMICDGAKAGCAAKLAISTSSAIECCMMAKGMCQLPLFNGIVGYTVEESIKNLGIVSSKGMVETDNVILEVMNEMNKKS